MERGAAESVSHGKVFGISVIRLSCLISAALLDLLSVGMLNYERRGRASLTVVLVEVHNICWLAPPPALVRRVPLRFASESLCPVLCDVLAGTRHDLCICHCRVSRGSQR
jgi:hypothetical protein